MSSTDRLLTVLALFNQEKEGLTVEQAAQKLDLPVSTVYRYFRSLAEAEFISAYAPGRYMLGSAIIEYDRRMRLHDPLISGAQPVMERLSCRFPAEHVLLLCRLYKTKVMCVHQEFRTRPPFAVSYERGRLMPLHRGAASKIILAHLPLRIIRGYHEAHGEDMAKVELGPGPADLKQQLKALRKAGWSRSNAELDSGMRGFAVPLFGPDGEILGSLGVVGTDPDMEAAGDALVIDLLKQARRDIEASLPCS